MKVTAYHGTNNRFESFDFGIIGKNTSDLDSVNLGACFTDSKEYASDYAKYAAYDGGAPTIITAEIEIDNPAEFNRDDLVRFCDHYGAMEYREMLIADGYDGIINYVDGKIEYICFYPEQIKIKEADC